MSENENEATPSVPSEVQRRWKKVRDKWRRFHRACVYFRSKGKEKATPCCKDEECCEEDLRKLRAMSRAHSLQKLQQGELVDLQAMEYSMAEILHTAQVLHLFLDSKEFVDMPMKTDPEEIFLAWSLLPNKSHLVREEMLEFVEKYYLPPGTEMEPFSAFVDHSASPPLLEKIRDPHLRSFAKHLNELWPKFGRVTTEDVHRNPQRYTLFPQKNPFLVPGGRFREFYYWDSFWIIKGLLLCGMAITARGMIENMIDMLDRFGFIPNGSRSYYLNRSQPPLLSEMVGRMCPYLLTSLFILCAFLCPFLTAIGLICLWAFLFLFCYRFRTSIH